MSLKIKFQKIQTLQKLIDWIIALIGADIISWVNTKSVCSIPFALDKLPIKYLR